MIVRVRLFVGPSSSARFRSCVVITRISRSTVVRGGWVLSTSFLFLQATSIPNSKRPCQTMLFRLLVRSTALLGFDAGSNKAKAISANVCEVGCGITGVCSTWYYFLVKRIFERSRNPAGSFLLGSQESKVKLNSSLEPLKRISLVQVGEF